MVVQTKAVIVGDGAIGKSCLVDAIKNPDQEMSEEYEPTIAKNHTVPCEYDGKQVRIDFWDTAGQEQFKALRKSSYSNTDVVVLGFCLKEASSLESIVEPTSGWVTEFQTKVEGFENWILCGTQKDLWDQTNPEHCQESRIFEVAEQIGAKQVIYTSAFTKEGCKECQDEVCKIGICVFDSVPITNWERPKPPAAAPPAAAGPAAAPAEGSAPAAAPDKNQNQKDGGCNCTLL